jgi:hypothetical protein
MKSTIFNRYNPIHSMKLLTCLFIALLVPQAVCHADDAISQWVHFNPHGKLVYQSLRRGDRIMDFSYAGYGGGGVPIPEFPVKATVSPGQPGMDDSLAIQDAIDKVSQMEIPGDPRGAVLLSPGTFNCQTTINITASGVVLRGSEGTIIRLSGPAHLAINISGKKNVTPARHTVRITDAYVPSGTDVFDVEDAQGLAVGNTIQIVRPVTRAWVEFMGMANLLRNDRQQRWLSGNLDAERVIKNIDGNRITVTVPLSDSYDATYLDPPGATAAKVTVSGLISQVGLEHVRIECPPQAVGISYPSYQSIHVDDAVDAWVRDVQIANTIGAVDILAGASRVTVQRVSVTHEEATIGAAKPGDFGADGTQTLFDRCTGTGNNLFYLITLGRLQGPNVALHCTFHGNGHIEPHMRWSTGLLLDNCKVMGSGGIDLMNRGIMGSGHGWTMGWGVAWNCSAKELLIQKPPGAMNWAIGCQGNPTNQPMPGTNQPILPSGEFDSPGAPVSPASLYLAQLRQRLGPDAVKNIGY